MTSVALLLTVLVPLSLAAAFAIRSWRPAIERVAAAAPIPAVWLAVVGGESSLELPSVLLGASWGLDPIGRAFLGFTAFSWLASGLFAQAYFARGSSPVSQPSGRRFHFFFLLTMAGNFGVVLAEDLGSFLLFFTLTSFASYGLITHDRKPASLHAGRIYIVMVVVGELLIFWGILLAAHEAESFRLDALAAGVAESPRKDWIVGSVLAGFGIKLGVMPFHFWLPLAHPAAPTPGSAVLSGAIIKTGLLGWLRFLPLGTAALPEWGMLCGGVGLATAMLGVLLGLPQRHPKAVLAYSSVSQMGLLAVAIGAAMLAPAAWGTIATVLLLYAAHHAVVKTALFLGVGVAAAPLPHVWQRRAVQGGLIVAAFSLAGLPLTSGFVAKSALKDAVAAAESWQGFWLEILPLTSVLTALLMLRYLGLLGLLETPRLLRSASDESCQPLAEDRSQPPSRDFGWPRTWGLLAPWGASALGTVLLFFIWRSQPVGSSKWFALDAVHLSSALWPILLAWALVIGVRVGPPVLRFGWLRGKVPAGDLAVPLATLTRVTSRAGRRQLLAVLAAATASGRRVARRVWRIRARRPWERAVRLLESDFSTGLALGLLALLLLILLAL
ncbi:complex I subunit 5 family protein [Candidatus Laterigemmans baculatus]|uniref:complex I subunit 5 family protein n=1 Tax=Candidatus Laterigemmans baculatus TaxID=2770505 RepID=UPI0013DAD739|nr:complex I subunit 5 family protein [Candidatus Laterigemmans baculatus]